MAFLNSPGNELFKIALKLFLTQDQRHENGQQKETTNPDNYETVLSSCILLVKQYKLTVQKRTTCLQLSMCF